MKKSMFDMKQELERRFRAECDAKSVTYLGVFPEKGQTYPASYKKFYEKFEQNLMKQLIDKTKRDN